MGKGDILSKRERVERTLNLLPVDRVAIHDHIWNPEVVSLYTGKKIDGFNYSLEDVCEATRKSMDMCRSPSVSHGTGRVITEDGFIIERDNWTSWIVKRPFNDTASLKEYCLREIEKMNTSEYDPKKTRENYRRRFLDIQELIGDTVIMDAYATPLKDCLWRAGIDLFSFLYYEEPEIIETWLQTLLENQLRMIHAIADSNLSPVILLVNEIGATRGPIISPDSLRRNHFPLIKRVVEVWHEHNIKVIYESQGNFEILIDDLLKCGIDGFYAIEPVAGMDIVGLKKKYPGLVWLCGIDGIDLMIRKEPEEVKREIRRQIEETDALNKGGLFVGTTSEVNPSIKVENYKAMVEEAKSIWNKNFLREKRDDEA